MYGDSGMDPSMAEVVAETGCPIVIMHNRSKPKDVNQRERLVWTIRRCRIR